MRCKHLMRDTLLMNVWLYSVLMFSCFTTDKQKKGMFSQVSCCKSLFLSSFTQGPPPIIFIVVDMKFSEIGSHACTAVRLAIAHLKSTGLLAATAVSMPVRPACCELREPWQHLMLLQNCWHNLAYIKKEADTLKVLQRNSLKEVSTYWNLKSKQYT